jgi:formylglycine-generating enzyme
MLESALFQLAPLALLILQREPVLLESLRAHLVPARQDMALVAGGSFESLFAAEPGAREAGVESFWLDRSAVTNGDFLGFVLRRPEWQRGRVSALFAETGYLEHWAGPTALGPNAGASQPVVRVSWFAAKAYCEGRGARLPGELEWEYASAASATQPDARQQAEWRAAILDWYARPAGAPLPDAGRGEANYWGVRDLHGVVWEWVLDFNFNAMLVSGDSRGGPADKQTFCGAGAALAGDRQDYAAFMRMAFLSSLQARYVTQTLGFRCAKPATPRSPS